MGIGKAPPAMGLVRALNFCIGIHGAKAAFCSDGFGQGIAGVGFFEERLALEIGEFDEIAVNDAEAAKSRANEQAGADGSESAAADENGAGFEQALLASFADGGEKDLARVFFAEPGFHEWARWTRNFYHIVFSNVGHRPYATC